MGDRIAISFVNGRERSPVLYSHWRGRDLIEDVQTFWQEHHGSIRDEPSNMMVNFITYIRNGEVYDGGEYLYSDEEHCCSPDDNGFWEMDTRTGEVIQTKKGEWEA